MFLHDVNFWVKGKFLHINKVSLTQIYTLYSPWSSILKIHYQECPLISSCSVAKLCLTLYDPLDCSPLAPALTDKFFITEPPGKPQYMTLFCDYFLDTQKLFFVVEFIQFGKIL